MKPTASSLERASICLPSTVLPQTFEVDEEYAERGRRIHAFLEDVGRGVPLEKALIVAGKYASLCSVLDLEALPIGGGFIQEVKFAFDTKTGKARRLKSRQVRDYSEATEDELTGTIDVLGFTDEAAVVGDYKSGMSVTEAKKNPQLRFLCLCAAREAGKDSAIGFLCYLHEDGSAYKDVATFDCFDLDEIEQETKALYARWRELEGVFKTGGLKALSPVEGNHCRHCNAFERCPAKTSLALVFAKPEVLQRWEDRTLQGNAADAYRTWKLAKQVLDRVGQKLHGYAREAPIDLGEGMFLGERTSEKRAIDGEAAWDALSALHGVDFARKAVEVTATFTSIKDALKPIVKERKAAGQKATLTAMEEEAVKAISERGGISVKKVTTIREYSINDKDA